jgi:aminodeoxyfutalosine deaminase
MIPTSEAVVVTSDWLVPVDASPIPNGFIVIEDGSIRFVGQDLPTGFRSVRLVHLPGYAILPGLINSHCHLEFSDLESPIPAGDSFPDWIGRLLAFRRSKNNAPEQLASNRQAAIASGIRESYLAGVRWVVDMVTEPWSLAWIENEVASIAATRLVGLAPKAPIVVKPCIELLDIVEQRFESTLALAIKHMDAPKRTTVVGGIGFAPHSPYTASRKVTRWCANLPSHEKRLVTMHLAESKEELQWLQHRNGPFAELLAPILGHGTSVDGQTYFDMLGQITEHIELLSQSWRATIAHGNYLSQRELIWLGKHAATMGVVHCPRTHRHFGHLHEASQIPPTNRYPFAERVALGVRHFLGTDSRASNPDLNLWTEAKLVRAEQPELKSKQIVKMITTDAAEFLDLGDEYGSVRAGYPATLTAIKLDRAIFCNGIVDDASSLYDALLEEDTVSAPLERVMANLPSNTRTNL